MGIDSISGPKGPMGPKGPQNKSIAAPETREATPSSGQSTVQALAAQVKQGSLSYDDAIVRYAADVVSRKFPNVTGALRERAIQDVGKALTQDPSFHSRFAKLLSGA